MPFGDYGQRGRERLARSRDLLSELLERQFGNFFIQADDDDPGFTTPGRPVPRSATSCAPDTSLDDLYGWLRRRAKTDETRN